MKTAVFGFENECKMNVLSQDDVLGNTVYNDIGCGTLASGPRDWFYQLQKEREAAARIAGRTMKKINHYFELAFKRCLNIYYFKNVGKLLEQKHIML